MIVGGWHCGAIGWKYVCAAVKEASGIGDGESFTLSTPVSRSWPQLGLVLIGHSAHSGVTAESGLRASLPVCLSTYVLVSPWTCI